MQKEKRQTKFGPGKMHHMHPQENTRQSFLVQFLSVQHFPYI